MFDVGLKTFSMYFILSLIMIPTEQVPRTTPISYTMIDKDSNLSSAIEVATNLILGDYDAKYGAGKGEKKFLFELTDTVPQLRMDGRRKNQWLFDWVPMNRKCIVMMQSLLYMSQDRMNSMERYTRKHAHRVGYRMAIIFNKLYQLLVDIKTMYTVAMLDGGMKTVPILYLYFHVHKKSIDITYIVEYMILMSQAYASGDIDKIKEFAR